MPRRGSYPSGYGNPEVRFWKKVDKNGPVTYKGTRCWEWTGGLFKSGYGAFYRGGKTTKAHRYSWELSYGPVADGLGVLHHCDNPRCVRPFHLFVGTSGDNSADMVSKGRSAKGDTHGSRTHPERVKKGQQHGMAKLTDEQVIEIRRLYKQGSSEFGSYGLAQRFGVSQHLIMRIIHRKNWTHLP